MYNKQFKKMVLLLIIGSFAGTVSAQTLLKLGDNPNTINDKAALEVESTTRGFLLPRMTRLERNAILAPVAGLQIWCTDCNGSSGPYIYTGTAWATIASSIAKTTLTTGKKTDASIFPTISDWNVVTIKGVLVQPSQALPTETGFVWKQILNDDFASLPYLDATGTASDPVYKKTSTITPVTTAGTEFTSGLITLSPPSWNGPFYFNTYAKTPLGIDYGNPIVFSNWPAAPPAPTVTFENGSPLMPVFNGILSINAGTPLGKLKAYGYVCSMNSGEVATATSSTTTGVLSTPSSIADFETYLSSETFTANYKVALPVKYNVLAVGTYYFRYYVTVTVLGIDRTLYSPEYSWYAAADPVTGGTAVATYVSVGDLTPPLSYGAVTNSNFPVVFNVLKKGSYNSFTFYDALKSGSTTGLSTSNTASGTFDAIGNKTINFLVNGTPFTSLAGNTFSNIPRLPGVTFNTGAMPTVNAVCDATSTTPFVYEEVTGPSGRIWMDRNLGASAAAMSLGDIRAFGCLYQWSRGNDGHANVTWGVSGNLINGTTTTLSTTVMPGHHYFITPTSGNYDWMATPNNFPLNYINNPCPSEFRVPSYSEAYADFGSWNGANVNDGFVKLKLTVPKIAGPNVNISGSTADMFYWTRDWAGAPGAMAIYLSGLNKTGPDMWRASGLPVRCIKNTGFLPTVSTGKKSDAIKPTYVSENSVTIKGTLLTLPSGGVPYDKDVRESGIIWKEITNDFTIFPEMPVRGLVAPPVYKKETSSAVSAVNGSIVVTTPATLNPNPYYYRAYVINMNGNVAYGNTVIFNVAPPTFTGPTVTPGTPKPTIAGTLIVNAGTDENIVTEYGYCVGTTNLPTNLVPLSTLTTIANLNASLDGETFTANPFIDLPVSSYTVTPNVVNYFRYYVKGRNGVITYSNTVSFTPTGL